MILAAKMTENPRQMKPADAPSRLYWCLLAAIALAFFVLNAYTPLYIDDWHYSYIFGTREPIRSLGDLLRSQYIHYMEWNGRLVPHFFVQLFDGMLGKAAFNVVNALMLPLLIHQLCRQFVPRRQWYAAASVILCLILFLLPGFNTCLLWMSGACNYLWTSVFLLLFHRTLFSERKVSALLLPLLFLWGIFCGWTHEGFVIGLSAAYALHFLCHRRLLSAQRIALLAGFCCGLLMIVVSPGMHQRAEAEANIPHSLPIFLKNYLLATVFIVFTARLFFLRMALVWVHGAREIGIKSFLRRHRFLLSAILLTSLIVLISWLIFGETLLSYIAILPLFMGLWVELQTLRRMPHLRSWARRNQIWWTALAVEILFVLFVNGRFQNIFFGAEFFSLILCIQLLFMSTHGLLQTLSAKALRRICLVLNIVALLTFIAVAVASRNNYRSLQRDIAAVQPDEEVMWTDRSNHLGRFVVNDYVEWFDSPWLARRLGKQKLVYLPRQLRDKLPELTQDGRFHLYRPWLFYIKALDDGGDSAAQTPTAATLLLRPSDFAAMPLPQRILAPHMSRYAATEWPAEVSVFRIGATRYVLVTCPEIFLPRVQGIRLEP